MTEKPVVKRSERPEDVQTLLPQVDVFENKEHWVCNPASPSRSRHLECAW